MKKATTNKWPYLFISALVIIILCIIFQDANIKYPFYLEGGDEMGVYYFAKTIRDFGIKLVNPMIGGTAGGDMYDYIYSDSLSFGLMKLLSLFISDIYVLTNVFYFFMYLLIAMTCLFVCRQLKYSNVTSVVVSILYSFSPYIQQRYGHMWLVPYFMIPFSCWLAIKIVRGDVVKEGQSLWKQKEFYQALVISVFCSCTGFYYAFFTCILYAIALVLRIINTNGKKIKHELYPIFMIFATAIGCFINIIPNLLYWMKNGSNPASELAIRNIGDSEYYGLKLIQLLLPRVNHRISFLQNFTQKYCTNYPLVTENITSSLGIIAAIGFIASLVWLFRNNKTDKTISYLNISTFMVATIGGIGSLFSLLIKTPMRCYNRMSVVIMFFSLIFIAELLDILSQKYNYKLFLLISAIVLVIGVFDQTINYVPTYDYAKHDSYKEFVKQIETEMPENSLIFELPYVNWPSGGNYRMFLGYLESENLRWSFGAMQGREEAVWQQETAAKDTNTMLATIASKGYSGIYLDKAVYVQMYGDETFLQICQELNQLLMCEPIVNSTEELYFWNMRNYLNQN